MSTEPVKQSLTQVNWPVAVLWKTGCSNKIGCAAIGEARMCKRQGRGHEECDSPTADPPSGAGSDFWCTESQAVHCDWCWVQWVPTPTCLTLASQDHMRKELGPRDKVPENRTYNDPIIRVNGAYVDGTS